ncbi:MAG: B12-binding domain-containing protein [Promethearchaeota archaeon]
MESSKDLIIKYLKANRGKEIPVSEISKKYSLKPNTISNAIKELNYKGEIIIERRRLNRGRYTVIWLNGDSIQYPFVHEKERIDLRLYNYFRDNGREISFRELIQYFGNNVAESQLTDISLKEAIQELIEKKKIESRTELLFEGEQLTIKPDDKFSIKGAKVTPEEPIPIPCDAAQIHKLIEYMKSSEYNSSIFERKISHFMKNNQTFVTCLITPLMIEVGELWAQTKISTAEEHVISNRIEKIIIDKINRVRVSDGRGKIILAPVEGEQHVISLLSLELIFSDLGYHTINIGRPLPIRSMIQYIKELKEKPQWLFMSITLRAYIGTLQHNLESIRNVFDDDIKIAIGGQGLIEKNRNEFPEADVIVINGQDFQKFIDFMS